MMRRLREQSGYFHLHNAEIAAEWQARLQEHATKISTRLGDIEGSVSNALRFDPG